jgi:predicted transcriptional regulator
MKTKLDLYIIEQVKQKRLENGLSQEAFGFNFNFSQSFITHCENPKLPQKYNINHVNEFAKFWGVSLHFFIPEQPL